MTRYPLPRRRRRNDHESAAITVTTLAGRSRTVAAEIIELTPTSARVRTQRLPLKSRGTMTIRLGESMAEASIRRIVRNVNTSRTTLDLDIVRASNSFDLEVLLRTALAAENSDPEHTKATPAPLEDLRPRHTSGRQPGGRRRGDRAAQANGKSTPTPSFPRRDNEGGATSGTCPPAGFAGRAQTDPDSS